jgi:hypothetical protein
LRLTAFLTATRYPLLQLLPEYSTLKGKTPAMAAGIAPTVWTVRDMLFAADQNITEEP